MGSCLDGVAARTGLVKLMLMTAHASERSRFACNSILALRRALVHISCQELASNEVKCRKGESLFW